MSKQNFKILIIDDSPEDRAAFRHFLQKSSEFTFNFIEAELGSAGIESCFAEKPDCVLLDYHLPDTNGIEVLEQINPDPLNPDFVVIVLTGAGDERLAVSALHKGAQDYLVKDRLSAGELTRSFINAREKHEMRRETLTILESITDAFVSLDADGCFTFVNAEAERLLHQSASELLGKPLTEKFPDVVGSGFEKKFAQAAETGETVSFEEYLPPLESWFEVRVYPSEKGLSIYFRNINERRAAEENRRLYEKIIVNTRDAVLITEAEPIDSPGPRIVFVNQAFCDMTGYTLEEVIGQTPRILQGAKTNRRKLDNIRHALENWETVRVELTNYRKDGSEFEVEFEIVPVADETGCYTHWISIQRDITARKAAEEKLRENQQRLRGIYDNTFQFMGLLQTDGTVIEANKTSLSFIGKQRADVVGRKFWETDWWRHSPNLQKKLKAAVKQAAAGDFMRFESTHISAVGDIAEIDFSLSPVKDNKGKVVLLVPEGRDITTRKAAEAKLRKRNEQLDLLAQISQQLIVGGQTEDELLQSIYGQLAMATGMEMFFTYKPLDESLLKLSLSYGLSQEETECFELIKFGERLCGRVAANRQPVVIEDLANIQLDWANDARAIGFQSYAGFPLLAGNRLIGTIAFASRWKTHFAEGELRMFQTVCDQLVATLERRRLTDELREAEQRQRLALESGGMGAWVWNLKDKHGIVDDQTLNLFGVSRDEWDGDQESLLTGILAEDKIHWEKAVDEALTQGKPYQSEFRVQLPDGRVRWLAGHGRVEYDHAGKPLQIRGINFDITERKQSEAAIKTLSDYNREVLESITDPFFTLDSEYRFSYMSSQSEKLLFRKPGELLGKVMWEEFPGVYNTPFEKMYRDALEKKIFSTVTDYYPDHNCWYEVLAYPSPNGVTVYFKDITERKRREMRLAFLADLQSDLTPLFTSEEIMRQAGKRIADYLLLDHCLFIEIDEAAETATVIHDERGSNSLDLVGTYQLKSFHTADECENLAAGKPVIINNIRSLESSAAADERFSEFEIAAMITSPFIGMARWKFVLSVQSSDPREWRADEIELVQELTTRIYTRLERVRAEESLRESETFNRTILEASPDCFKILDGDGYLQYMNPNGLCIMEIDDFSLVENQLWWDLWLEETRDKIRASVVAAQRGEVARFQEFCPTAKGTPKWWDVIVAPVGGTNGNGKPSRIISVSRDITDTKRAEISTRDSEERLRLTMDAAKVSTWDWNIETGEVKWSENLKLLVGMNKGEFGQNFESFIKLVHPDDVNLVQKSLEKALTTEQDYNIEFRMVRPSGEIRWTSTRGRVLRNENGKPYRMLGIDLDITERKQSESEREHLLEREKNARREAEDANRAKDEFLAMLSHELRSPLNSMYGWTQMLLTGKVSAEKMQHAIEVIARNIRLQNALIEDLLDVSRIISGKMQLEKETISLVALVQTAIEAARPAAEKQGVGLSSSLSVEVDEIIGDPHRLSQVVGNLLTNAVKFTPAGGSVSVELRRSEKCAILTVQDTGIGIEPEALHRIFDRFRQADASSKRKFGGLGLGLAIVKHLIELHGGAVTAFSDGEGHGATFTVSLPLIRETSVKSDFLAAGKSFGANGQNEKPLAGLQVLLVDDDSDSLDLMSFIIESNGARAVCVSSASEAIKKLSDAKFDLLISDIGMAEMDGYDLIKKIRKKELAKSAPSKIPAIALTGYVSAEDRERVRAAGFQKHLPKPIDMDLLMEVILNLLKGGRK